jgi:hypothetical protein
VVIHNLDIVSVAAPPPKTHAPLTVDAYAVLALALSRKFLKAI